MLNQQLVWLVQYPSCYSMAQHACIYQHIEATFTDYCNLWVTPQLVFRLHNPSLYFPGPLIISELCIENVQIAEFE